MASPSERLSALLALAGGKTAIALPPTELKRLTGFLSERFGIGFPGDLATWEARVTASLPPSRRQQLFELINARSPARRGGPVPAKLDRQFYDFVADDPLVGLVHSLKWVYILDAAALLTVLLRHLKVAGAILDVGCHAGYHALWLAYQLGVRVEGLDISCPAIAYAARKAAELNITTSFQCGHWTTAGSLGTYDLIYNITGPELMDDKGQYLPWVSRRLAEGGVYVHAGNGPELREPGRLARLAAKNDLGFGMADIIGGWDGDQWLAIPVLVFVKGTSSPVPANLASHSDSLWPLFQRYMNGQDRAPEEQGQAHWRTSLLGQ